MSPSSSSSSSSTTTTTTTTTTAVRKQQNGVHSETNSVTSSSGHNHDEILNAKHAAILERIDKIHNSPPAESSVFNFKTACEYFILI